jgi:hypothetical protein
MYRAAEPKPVIRRMAEELVVHHDAVRVARGVRGAADDTDAEPDHVP